MPLSSHLEFLERALRKADESVAQGGFPAGAVIVKNGVIIGEGISIGTILQDCTSHGEMDSIRNACKNIKSTDLTGATLYASMQPCLMCFGAAMWSGISEIVYACSMERVAPEYYGGHYNMLPINTQLLRPVIFTHIAALEEKSLATVRAWEASHT